MQPASPISNPVNQFSSVVELYMDGTSYQDLSNFDRAVTNTSTTITASGYLFNSTVTNEHIAVDSTADPILINNEDLYTIDIEFEPTTAMVNDSLLSGLYVGRLTVSIWNGMIRVARNSVAWDASTNLAPIQGQSNRLVIWHREGEWVINLNGVEETHAIIQDYTFGDQVLLGIRTQGNSLDLNTRFDGYISKVLLTKGALVPL